MATVTVADAKNHFSDLLRRAEYGGERVIVERHGKPVAVIVSTDDLKRLEALEDVSDVHDAKAALKEAAEHGDPNASLTSVQTTRAPVCRSPTRRARGPSRCR